MRLTENMINTLDAIRKIEPTMFSNTLNMSANELGNLLISVYCQTPSLEAQALITKFMDEAGVVWMRKLLTKDSSPISSSESRFASMRDYMSLISINSEELVVGSN